MLGVGPGTRPRRADPRVCPLPTLVAAQVDDEDAHDCVLVAVGACLVRRVVFVVDPPGTGDLIVHAARPPVLALVVVSPEHAAGADLGVLVGGLGDVVVELLGVLKAGTVREVLPGAGVLLVHEQSPGWGGERSTFGRLGRRVRTVGAGFGAGHPVGATLTLKVCPADRMCPRGGSAAYACQSGEGAV